ncbi:monocarboxylate transporter 12-like [Lineus longissimus]|uniref:monocarboxylate transporter 12-like n=1 Tax=Lineus longissimus TaxID=88925 RepID=UPI002B4C3601
MLSEPGGVDSETSKNEDSVDEDVPPPPSSESSAPDGGYGWVVCISGFFCWFIGDGIAFSYGVLYVSLLEQFNEGPSTTSWVGAAFIGGHNLMGPVAGVSVKQLGCRATVFLGSIIAASGFVLGTFSRNIAMLALTYGAMGGSGLNFLLVASVDMVAKYFNRHRALANGIVTCGAGAGGFIVPLLLKFLIDKYRWDGSLLILAGISLNGCVLGALFRHLETRGEVIVAVSKPESSEEPVADAAAGSETKFHITDATESNGGSVSSSYEAGVNRLHPRGYGQSLEAEYSSAVFIGSMASISGIEIKKTTHVNYRRRSLAVVTSHLKSCQELFGLNLIYVHPMFILIIISCTFWTAQTTMFIYLVDYALSRDIDKTHGTILLSIIGILNTIGRILIGLLTDHPKVDCYVVYGLSLVIAGVVNMAVPFCTNFAVLAVCSAVFGLCVACFVSLRAIIIVDFLGMDQMVRGFGVVLFCQGIGFLIGPPIAAAIYEASGTYVTTFLTAGVFLILGALAIIPVRLLKRKSSSVT